MKTFILTAQNISQIMSNSYVIITKCFRLRFTANFFPIRNTVNNKQLKCHVLNVMYLMLCTECCVLNVMYLMLCT
jgi:hypothetical protein